MSERFPLPGERYQKIRYPFNKMTVIGSIRWGEHWQSLCVSDDTDEEFGVFVAYFNPGNPSYRYKRIDE